VAAGFFVRGLIMTLKKSKRGQARGTKGQAIFEYFILTTAVVAVVLLLAGNTYFESIRTSCANAFNKAVEEILK